LIAVAVEQSGREGDGNSIFVIRKAGNPANLYGQDRTTDDEQVEKFTDHCGVTSRSDARNMKLYRKVKEFF
jgi:hypothetical protein